MNEGPVVACYQFGPRQVMMIWEYWVKKEDKFMEEYVKLKTMEILKKKEILAWKEIFI